MRKCAAKNFPLTPPFFYEETLKKLSRMGAYGILLRKKTIALVKKTQGPYKDLLDLPGGGIEFGESPLEALKREIREELAIETIKTDIFDNYSHLSVWNASPPVAFHHLGIIYLIDRFQLIKDAAAEEQWDWLPIDRLHIHTLSPFARRACLHFK